jgi:Txe/YoeB family toxin of Txe-Axe toxin-antitoxin module
LVAEDADLIEKEWVERAKKIILETKDDPFARTNRVNELQKDYLQKRYNKNLGA